MASSRVVEVHNRAHFRVGSNASVGRSARDFRFSPINGHRETDPTCLKGANIGSANHQFVVVATSLLILDQQRFWSL